MISVIKNFIDDQSGVSAIEYSLIAGVCIVALVVVIDHLGLRMHGEFLEVTSILRSK
jgi:Flp pilus assembly pilin Flp